jgi:hypothetical protein
MDEVLYPRRPVSSYDPAVLPVAEMVAAGS